MKTKRYGKRRFKKRSYRKSRSIKKTKTQPLMRQSRLFRHKCTDVIPVDIGNETAGFEKNFTFARFDFKSVILGDVYGCNSPPRFNRVVKNYEEFAVTGLSVKFFPTNLNGTVNPGAN